MTAIAFWTGYEILMLKGTSQPEVLLLYGVSGGYEAPISTLHAIEIMQRSGSRFL